MLPDPTIRPAVLAEAEALIAHKLKLRAEPDDNSHDHPARRDSSLTAVEKSASHNCGISACGGP